MIVLSDEQLKEVLASLPEYYPKSLQMDVIIRNKLNGRFSWPGTEIVVDKFPEFSVLMFRPAKGAKDYVSWPRVYSMTIFCRNPEELTEVIQSDDFPDSMKSVLFFAISRKDVYPILRKRLEELGTIEGSSSGDWGIVHLLNPSNLVKSEIPEGFHLGELTEANAEQISKEWHFGGPNSLPFLRHLLQNKFPSSGIFTNEGRLVAYILYGTDGSMFSGFVHPEFRKKGLFQIVNYDLTNKVVAIGQPIPWAYVARSNEASLNSYRKLGAKKLEPEEYSIDWFLFRPTAN